MSSDFVLVKRGGSAGADYTVWTHLDGYRTHLLIHQLHYLICEDNKAAKSSPSEHILNVKLALFYLFSAGI